MSKVNFINKFLCLSASDDGTKLNGKVLICPLDESNLNGVGIKKEDLTDSELQTLSGQPAVAKVIKNKDGELDFGGHELKKVQEYNTKTKKIETKYIFDTQPIGYFTDVDIEDIEIEGEMKSCIVANVEFWTRYENATTVLLKLFDEGNLHTSWELTFSEKYMEDEVKWVKGITFIGVAVLGTEKPPAYPISGVIEMSELKDEESNELAEAFTQDLIKENLKNKLDDNQGGKRMSEKNKSNEVASLTENDLYSRVRKAINATDENKYYYIARLYPYEYRAVAYLCWDRESEDDYIEFTYTVNSDETISIKSQKNVKMQFVAVETIKELETQVSEKETKVTDLEKELSEKNEAIIDLDKKVAEKEAEIGELQPFKEQIEKAESEKKEAETAQKKEDLKKLALKSTYISEEDLKTPEISELIEQLDEKGIKSIIADKVMAKAEENKSKEPEVSEKKKDVHEESNLEYSEDTLIGEDPISMFLKKNI